METMSKDLMLIESLLSQNTQKLLELVVRVEKDMIDDVDCRQLLSVLTKISTTDINPVEVLEGCAIWCYENNVKTINRKEISEIIARIRDKWFERLTELMRQSSEDVRPIRCYHNVDCYIFLSDTKALKIFYENYRKNSLLSLFDGDGFESSRKTEYLARILSSYVQCDSIIFPKIFSQSDIIDIYYNCLIDQVDKMLQLMATNHSFDSVIRADSREIVFLSINEETVSVNSSPEKISVIKIVEMIKFFARFEKRWKSRSNRQWDWRPVFAPVVPEICRWVEKQIRSVSTLFVENEKSLIENEIDVNYTSLVENLTDLAEASAHELTAVTNMISAVLKQFCRDFFNFSFRLSQKNSESIDSMYALLNSVSRFSLVLEKCRLVFEDAEIYQLREEFVSLASSFVKQIIFRHKSLLLTSIFQDAESHDWCKDKPFFENERISFTIQMWSLHVRRLRCDLSKVSPIYARQIYSDILSFSLFWFAQRYARAKPSCCRIPQFKADIVAILLNAEEFILTCDNEVSVHECCCNLLATLAVVCAPFQVLCGTYENGFPNNGNDDWHPTEWLHLFSPSTNKRSIEYCLKSIEYQFKPHWPSVVKLLVMDDSFVPFKIIESCEESRSDLSVNDMRNVLNALVSCHQFPHCLGSTLIRLIKRYNHWEHLLSFASYEDRLPLWIQSLDDILEEYCAPIVGPLFLNVLRYYSQQVFNDFITTNKMSLKCEKKYFDASTTADRLVDDATITFATLPRPLQFTFEMLQRELPHSEKNKLVTDSVYLHMIVTKCIRLLTSYSKESRVDVGRFADDLLQNIGKKSILTNIHLLSEPNNLGNYDIAATQMMSEERGSNSLKQFHEYLVKNQHLLGSESNTNPLNQPIDHSRFFHFQFDWHKIFTSRLISSETTFRLLLANRWEMRDDEQSDETRTFKYLYGFDVN